MYKDEKFWDRIASKFDTIEKGDTAYGIFIEQARAYVKTSDTVMDFGCGTGLICNEIAENVGFIHAIDISAKMIEIAKHKASARNIRNIGFERTTILDKKFKEGSIDAIVAFNIFHLLEDPHVYFQRMHQILKPGGLILSSTPCMREAPLLNHVLSFFSRMGITPVLNPFTGSELEQFFVKASFKTIQLDKIKPKSPQYICILKKDQAMDASFKLP